MAEIITNSLQFDGTDWYDIPVIPSSGDFKIGLEVYWPSGGTQEGDYKGVFVFGEEAGVVDCFLNMAIRNSSSPFVQLRYVPDGGGQSSINTGTIKFDEWTRIEIERIGTIIYVRKWGADNVLDENSTEPNTGLQTFTIGTFGAMRSMWWSGHTNPADFLPAGTRIRNVYGGLFELGELYTDIPPTIIATNGEAVASVVNSGSIGGNFEQSVLTDRAILYKSIVDTDLTNTIEFDGSDYLRLPALTDAGFDFNFWFYAPAVSSGNNTIFTADNYTLFGTQGMRFNFLDLGNGGNQFELWESGVQASDFISAVYPNDAWYHIRLMGDPLDGKVKIWITQEDDSVEYGEFIKDLILPYEDMISVNLGGYILGFFGYDDDTNSHMDAGSKIKDLKGTFEFEVFYSDRERTTQAGNGDNVEAIETPAGYAFQDFPARSPILHQTNLVSLVAIFTVASGISPIVPEFLPEFHSMIDHMIDTQTFRENTILHRLKGINIIDDKRDIDHPRNRK